MTLTFAYKTRLLLTAGALFSICAAPAVARAQSSGETAQMMNRLNEIENEMQTLNRAVYKGDMSGAAQAGAGDAAAAANYEQRMSAIEDEQRKLTGQIEKNSFDVQQIKDRLDRAQTDTEQRLQRVEHGGQPAAAPSSVVVPPQPEAPAASASSPAGGTLGTLKETPSGTEDGSHGPAEALYEEAFADVRDGKYDEGEAKLKQFISQYPGHPLSANAQYWLGETYYVRGDYRQAAKTFAQGYQTYPKSNKAEDCLFKLALSLAKLGKKDDACLSLRQLQKDFSGDTGPLHLKTQAEIKQLDCP